MSQSYTNFIQQFIESKFKVITLPRGTAPLSNTHLRTIKRRGFDVGKDDDIEGAIEKVKQNIFLAFYYATPIDATVNDISESLKLIISKEDDLKNKKWIQEYTEKGADEPPPELYNIDTIQPWDARYVSETSVVINNADSELASIFNTSASSVATSGGELVFMYKTPDLQRLASAAASQETLLTKVVDYNVFIDTYGVSITFVGAYDPHKLTLWITQKEDSLNVFLLALVSYNDKKKSKKKITETFHLQYAHPAKIQDIIAHISTTAPPTKMGVAISVPPVKSIIDEQLLQTVFSEYRHITINGLGSYILADIHSISSNKSAGILLDTDSKVKVGIFRGLLTESSDSGACEIVWEPEFERTHSLHAPKTLE